MYPRLLIIALLFTPIINASLGNILAFIIFPYALVAYTLISKIPELQTASSTFTIIMILSVLKDIVDWAEAFAYSEKKKYQYRW
jgi:hypothetical protein